jgi:hypothetical protein
LITARRRGGLRAAAREWMRGRYEARRGGGAGSAEAVREAGRRALAARRRAGLGTHPFRRGSFVAAGDWR